MDLQTFKARYTAFQEGQGVKVRDEGTVAVLEHRSPGRTYWVYHAWEKLMQDTALRVRWEGEEGIDQAPSVIIKGNANQFASGEWRWVGHEYGDGPQPCIDDFASPIARAQWKDYHVERDANGNITREGPRPFKSVAEQREYERLTGLVTAGAGEIRPTNPYEETFRKYPRLRDKFPEFANWGKQVDNGITLGSPDPVQVEATDFHED